MAQTSEEVTSSISWGDSLKHVAWRVDVASKSRNVSDVSSASAIVELTVGTQDAEVNECKVITFDMDKETLGRVLDSVNEIQEQLAKHS